MPEKHFGKLVDDYLANRISPDELKWLKQKVNTDDDSRKIFQRKCSQHQVSQYFMVQQAPPSNWKQESVPEEPVASTIHLAPEIGQNEDEPLDTADHFEEPIFNLRDFIDFSLASGLACVTIVILVCWLDRAQIFSPEMSLQVERHPVQDSQEGNTVQFSPNAYHNLITPTKLRDAGEPVRGDWMGLQQLEWYLRNQFPQSAPLDLARMEFLQQRWELPPDMFPHSILTRNTIYP